MCTFTNFHTEGKCRAGEKYVIFLVLFSVCYLLNHAKVEDDNYLGQETKILNPSLSVAAVKSPFFCQVFQSIVLHLKVL